MELSALCQSLSSGKEEAPKDRTRSLLLASLSSGSCHESFLAAKGLIEWSRQYQELSWVPLALSALKKGANVQEGKARDKLPPPHVMAHLVKGLSSLASAVRKEEERALSPCTVNDSLVQTLSVLRESAYVFDTEPLEAFTYLTALQVTLFVRICLQFHEYASCRPPSKYRAACRRKNTI